MTLDEIEARCTVCGDCWEWSAPATTEHRRCHPQIKQGGKPLLVRRVAYALAHGSIPAGRKLAPDCGNQRCINPVHQVALTESQKGRRAAAKGSFNNPVRAAKIAATKREQGRLTLQQAQDIRNSDEPAPVLANRYGVHRSLVGRIRRGENWKDYSSPFSGLMATERS